jgi:hypothetical protein
MRRLALAFVLGIAVGSVMLPPTASAWTRGGHARGHGVVVAGPGFVVAGPRIPVPVPVVRPFPHRVFVAPRPVFVAPPPVVFAPPPFFAPAPWPHCARWWWNGWRWVRGC